MREREDGKAIGAGADPGSRQQKSEQRQARNGLNDIGAAEHRPLQDGPAGDQNAERNSDEHGEKYRGTDQP